MTKIDVPTIEDADISDIAEFTPEVLADDSVDWKAKAQEFAGIARRRTTQLKKTKDFLNTHKDKFVEKPADTPANDPNNQQPKKGELDYGQKAYLVANGVKDAEDIAFVQKTMTDSGRTLEEVLATPFVQAELKRLGEERTTKAAQPPADGRQQAPARDTVEYWIAKGEMPPADQPKLRQQYVNAKIAKDKSNSNFTNTPVVGQA